MLTWGGSRRGAPGRVELVDGQQRMAESTLGSELIEKLVRQDRHAVAAGLFLVTAMAWWYLFIGAGMDMKMGAMDMRMPMVWSPGYATVAFLMWWIMMVPSAAPMILLFATVNRRSRATGSPYVPTTIFAAGYLIAWGLFSLLATGLPLDHGHRCAGIAGKTVPRGHPSGSPQRLGLCGLGYTVACLTGVGLQKTGRTRVTRRVAERYHRRGGRRRAFVGGAARQGENRCRSRRCGSCGASLRDKGRRARSHPGSGRRRGLPRRLLVEHVLGVRLCHRFSARRIDAVALHGLLRAGWG